MRTNAKLQPNYYTAFFRMLVISQATRTHWANMGTRWFGGQEVADRMLHRYDMGPMWFSIQMECYIGENVVSI